MIHLTKNSFSDITCCLWWLLVFKHEKTSRCCQSWSLIWRVLSDDGGKAFCAHDWTQKKNNTECSDEINVPKNFRQCRDTVEDFVLSFQNFPFSYCKNQYSRLYQLIKNDVMMHVCIWWARITVKNHLRMKIYYFLILWTGRQKKKDGAIASYFSSTNSPIYTSGVTLSWNQKVFTKICFKVQKIVIYCIF